MSYHPSDHNGKERLSRSPLGLHINLPVPVAKGKYDALVFVRVNGDYSTFKVK